MTTPTPQTTPRPATAPDPRTAAWSWGEDVDLGGGAKLPDCTLVVDKRTRRAKGGR